MIGIISSSFQNEHLFQDALQLPVVGGAGCVQYLILMTIVMMIIIDYRHDDHLDNDYPHDGHHEVHDHDNAEQAPGLRWVRGAGAVWPGLREDGCSWDLQVLQLLQ